MPSSDSSWPPSVNSLVNKWMQDLPVAQGERRSSPAFDATFSLIRLLAEELYVDYQPFPESSPFLERLAEWLDNLRGDSASQQLMFQLVPWLLFIGRREMETMYRAAFTGPITQWIIDTAALDITQPDLPANFEKALQQTWFGSLAGMDIGSFMRINKLDQQSLRPDFRVLSSFVTDPEAIIEYLRQPKRRRQLPYRRIVVVEDYVGTGTQMKEAAELLQKIPLPILMCPIVCGPVGVEMGRQIAANSDHVTFREYFQIPPAACLERERAVEEPEFFEQLRDLLARTWDRINDGSHGDSRFGFTNGDVPSPALLTITHLNCPNNAPALIHRRRSDWKPLFERIVREG